MGEGAVDRLIAESRAEACAAGRKLALVHEIACAAPVAEFAAVEVACALTLSRFAAENLVTLASGLCDRLPTVLYALSNGDIDLYKARVFSEVLADLDVAVAQSIAALVLPKAATRTAGQLRDLLRRKALAADPAYAAARRERASAHRAVQLHASDDGTASLTAFGLDAARATAAMQRIAAIARQRQFTSDPTSTNPATAGTATADPSGSGRVSADQLRADVFLELLEGKHDGAARGVVNLTVSLETLARFNDDPASLGGFGVIAADISRQWLAAHPGYQWQYAVHHPTDGTLLQQGLIRPPTANASPHGPRPGTGTVTDLVPIGTGTGPAPGTQHGTGSSTGSRNSTSTSSSSTSSSRSRGPGWTKANGEKAPARTGSALTNTDGAWQNTDAAANSGAAPAGVQRAGRAGARADGAGESLVRPPVQDPRDRVANAAMTRWIRLRDKTCRAPGCRMPAWQTDIDHNQRYADGGLTAHDNLCALCRHHHRAKDEGGWVLIQTRPGHFTWISPQGRIYEVGPEPP